ETPMDAQYPSLLPLSESVRSDDSVRDRSVPWRSRGLLMPKARVCWDFWGGAANVGPKFTQCVHSNLLLTRSSTMARVRTFLEHRRRDEDGVTMLEYTILLGIITVAVIASVVTAGNWVAGKWTTLVSKLT